MHHSCNLEYEVHGGMKQSSLKLREMLVEMIWWPLVVSRGHDGEVGPWWSRAKNGSYGIYGQKWIQGVFGPIWVQGTGGQKWLRWAQLWFGTHLAAPFGPFWPHWIRPKGA